MTCNNCTELIAFKQNRLFWLSRMNPHTHTLWVSICKMYSQLLSVGFCGKYKMHFEISPGSILARVKRVESLATKQEENNSAASFP